MKEFLEKMKQFGRIHQQKIVLVIGYMLVGLLAFGLGRLTSPKKEAPDIRVEQQANLPANYTPTVAGLQTNTAPVQAITTTTDNCAGKIKGSSSMIYHVPGGAFYDKTTHPTRCFDTEAQAQAAGFRKSSR